MNNQDLTTPRDIRLKLASMLDLLGQVQNSEVWEALAIQYPTLSDQFQITQTTLDDLWYLFRCATTNPGE